MGNEAFGAWRVVRLGAIDSTNEEARRRAIAGDPGCLWIVAEEQSAGRGRRGRTWISPKGNLYASALLIDPCPQALSPQLGFVAGVALAKAAADVGALGARLKWPNDLLLSSAKCAGLLVEGVGLPEGRFACLLGVGVNCLSAPEGVLYPATILRDGQHRPADVEALLERLMARFEEALADWRRGEGFASIRLAWLERAAGVGEPVRIVGLGGARDGVFAGLDAHGRLLFRGESGVEAIEAADLWLSPASEGSPPAFPSVTRARLAK